MCVIYNDDNAGRRHCRDRVGREQATGQRSNQHVTHVFYVF